MLSKPQTASEKQQQPLLAGSNPSSLRSNRWKKPVAVLLLLAAFYLALKQFYPHFPAAIDSDDNSKIDPAQIFMQIPSTERLREHLRYYASGTHVAGINHTQAIYTRDFFENQGIDAKVVEYYPWLNYPVDQRVALFDPETEKVAFEAGLKEDVIPGDSATDDPNNLPAFHGMSADGNVTGQLVYANYGSLEDLSALKAAGISIRDKIVLVRYGGMLRGLKVYAAGLEGARGVLIYSDPAEDGYGVGKVYPEGPWRPESSFQRGSVSLLQVYPGDPLTPGYPATKDAPRLDPRDVKCLNRIPSLPLSYRDAKPLLRALAGHGKNASDVGSHWVGGLASQGVEYWTGPSALHVNLLNRVEFKQAPIQNVIGTIKGWEDPERAVIIGNHRDAWCAGAADPSSGSAALLELARGFGELLKLGWRPRRTIVLASWDAEEYSLVGSTEWVEENVDWLRADAVAYVNVDVAVAGGEFYAQASPILKGILYDTAKAVPYPHSNQSLYDAWLEQSLGNSGDGDIFSKDSLKKSLPPVPPLGSGSDFTAFMSHVGVSSLNMVFEGKLGTYHSNYDSFKWMTTFVDPDMAIHQAMARLWGLVTLRLADDAVLDMRPVDYAKDLKLYIQEIRNHVASRIYKAKDGAAMMSASKKLRHLRFAQRRMLIDAHALERNKRHLRSTYGEGCQMKNGRRRQRCLKLRKSINDRVARLERHFIDAEGIPDREWYKHVLTSPGRWMGYGPQVFPVLAEAADDQDWKKFKQYEKRTAEIVREAAWFLREV